MHDASSPPTREVVSGHVAWTMTVVFRKQLIHH